MKKRHLEGTPVINEKPLFSNRKSDMYDFCTKDVSRTFIFSGVKTLINGNNNGQRRGVGFTCPCTCGLSY